MTPENYIVIIPIVLFIVASLAMVLKKETSVKVSSIISAIGSSTLILVSFIGFMHDIDIKYVIWDANGSSILSSLCTVHIHIDKLSSIFVGLTGIITLLASVYAIKYIEKHKSGYHRLLSFSYPLTVLTMYLLFVSWDLLWLLIFWELLTLFSQFIVVFKGDKEAISGAYQYFTITKACADVLVIALVTLIIIVTGLKTSYDDVSLALWAYFSGNKAIGYLLAILALVGFGAKAGLAPFHTWLPKAHPAAPTHISAILSGLIVKTGVYALMRTFLVFFPTDATIGLIVASFGILTIIVGNMRALAQDDSKRLLAYSTIGQIGYIFLPMGAGIYLIGIGQTLLGGFALVASLYHTINHAFFKSLLFLTSGSILYATGSRDLNIIGGLSRQMPYTAFAALIGALSIAGVPPLNGFVSKWMIYSSLLPSATITSLFGIIALAMSAVTAAYIMKFFTAAFLKPPKVKLDVNEVPGLMSATQITAAAFCILLGVYPNFIVKVCSDALISLGYPISYESFKILPGVVLPNTAAFMPILVLMAVFLLAPLLGLAVGVDRIDNTWTTGYPRPTSAMTSFGYYKDLREGFSEYYSISKELLASARSLSSAILKVGFSYEDISYDLNTMLYGAAVFLVMGIFVILWGVIS